MTITFSALGISEQLLNALNLLGFEEPTPIQAQCIPALLSGKDIIGKARTGSGKTAAFGLPLIQNIDLKSKAPKALILTPTRELALQVSDALTSFCAGQPARILSIYGGTSYRPQLDALKRGVSIVVGTPGRVLDLIEKGGLKLDAVEYAVLDEADEMLRMGFIEDVETILGKTNPDRQTALFSATMPPPIQQIGISFMKNPIEIEVETQKLSTGHIHQKWISVQQKHKPELLHRILEAWVHDAALIFTKTKQGCAELADILTERGLIASALHGDMNQSAREHVIDRFRKNALRFVVATDVAARGIDVDHISHVINYDLTNDLESYVHRIGRTGRAGREGTAISFITPAENNKLRYFEQKLKLKLERCEPPSLAELAQQRWNELKTDLITKEPKITARVQSWRLELQEMCGQNPENLANLLLQELLLQKGVSLEDRHDTLLDTKSQDKSKKQSASESTEHEDCNEQDVVLNIGTRDNVQVRDILWAISTMAQINSKLIGSIKIMERKSYVGLPERIAQPLIEKKKSIEMHGRSVSVFEKIEQDSRNRRIFSEHPASMRKRKNLGKKRK